MTAAKALPGPRGLLTSGLLFLRRDPATFLSLARKYGDFFRFKVVPREVFVVSDPRQIERIFNDHYEHFEKDWGPRRGAWTFGNGLLTSEGGEHRARRQQASAFFAYGHTPASTYRARNSSALGTKSAWNWNTPPCPASG